MIRNIINMLISPDSSYEMLNFRYGFLAGIIITLILLLLVKFLIFRLFFRKNKITEITIPKEGGDLTVSSNAVIDLIKIVSSDFEYLTVSKAFITKSGSSYTIYIEVKYDISGTPFMELCHTFQEEINKNIEARLGIKNINDIKIHCAKTLTNKE